MLVIILVMRLLISRLSILVIRLLVLLRCVMRVRWKCLVMVS